MNIVILSGNLGQDPQIRYTAQGVPVAQFSMAVNYVKGDEKRTNWINVVAFRKQAELVVDYLKKGSRVAIEGTLRTRTWT
ncbi:single-stranded DNA-binding protein, partial [Candidatus Bathyarchaeota archaeon]